MLKRIYQGKQIHMFNEIKLHQKILLNLIFVILSILIIIPLWLAISISFSAEGEMFRNGYKLIPGQFSTAAYKFLFSQPDVILNAYRVSMSVTAIGTILGLVISTGLAYITVRKDFRYRNIVSFFVFFTILFQGGLVPYYIIITRWLHLGNSLWALIMPYLVIPMFVLFLKGFLQGLPNELFESAKMDGASELRIFFQIVIPLSKPGLATVGLFFLLRYWNDWFLALLFIEDFDKTPLQLMLARVMQNIQFIRENAASLAAFQGSMEDLPSEALRMATLIIAAGPMLFIFPFFQKYFVKGLTVGSIKG
jgi:putative aldouronate transport system permease protein